MELPDEYRNCVRFSFGDTPELADLLLGFVLAGTKTATCGALRHGVYEGGEPMPRVGRRDVVLDGQGRPRAVIETTEVTVRRFRVVPEDFALAEGEGTYAEWRRNHEVYFARSGGFDPDMQVVCERFRLVAVLADG